MARIRTLKPEFWTDGNMIVLSVWARLFYIGSWNFACDRGHLPDDPLGLKLKVLPADQVDATGLVAELLDAGRIERRRLADGRTYLTIPRFVDHQKLDPRWKSRCPFCSGEDGGNWTRVEPEAHQSSPKLAETQASPAETHRSLGEPLPTASAPPVSSENVKPHRDSPKLTQTHRRSGGEGIGGELSTRAPSETETEIVDAEIVSDDSGEPSTDLVSTQPVDNPAFHPNAIEPNAGNILAAWIDHCRTHNVQLTKRVIGHYAKRIKEAVDQGFHPNLIKTALGNMLAEGVAGKPSYLDNHLIQVQNGPQRRPRRLTPGEETAMRLTNNGQNAEVIDLFRQIVRPA